MTKGEVFAIIQLLDVCKKDMSLKNVKKVARAVGIEVVDGDRKFIEKTIQISLDIKKEEEIIEEEEKQKYGF